MNLIAYLRVSTSHQELGPEAQRDMITAYAAEHGHTIVAWYEERISGGADLDKRQVLLDAIGALSEGMQRAGWHGVGRHSRWQQRGRLPDVDTRPNYLQATGTQPMLHTSQIQQQEP